MKIADAAAKYAVRIKNLCDERDALYEKKEALIKGEIQLSDDEIRKLRKSIDRVELSSEHAQTVFDDIKAQKGENQAFTALGQQSDAMAKAADDYAKCIEVARRIAKGDTVPAKDEKKLLDFSAEMYQMAKSMAAVAQNEKSKKHKSLWKDEDDETRPTPEEPSGDMEPGTDSAADIAIDVDIDADIG